MKHFVCLAFIFISLTCNLRTAEFPDVVLLEGPPTYTMHGAGGYGGCPIFADFSPDGTKVALTNGDYIVRIFDAESGKVLQKLKGHTKLVRSLTFFPDGKKILTVSNDKTLRIWNVESGKELHKFGDVIRISRTDVPLPPPPLSPDGKKIVTAGQDNTALIWDTESGGELQSLKGHSGTILTAVFSPDGKKIITGSADDSARIWDVESGKMLHVFPSIRPVGSVAFSPDGTKVATGHVFGDRVVQSRIWDAESGEMLHNLNWQAHMTTEIMFSPDGENLAMASGDGAVWIWDVPSGTVLHKLKGYSAWDRSITFSPCGRKILTTLSDGTARIWDVESGEELEKFEWYPEEEPGMLISRWNRNSLGILSGNFSLDGKKLVTAGGNGTAQVWDLERLPPPELRPRPSRLFEKDIDIQKFMPMFIP